MWLAIRGDREEEASAMREWMLSEMTCEEKSSTLLARVWILFQSGEVLKGESSGRIERIPAARQPLKELVK